MKKIAAIFLVVALMCASCISVFANNEVNYEAETHDTVNAEFDIRAKSAVLMEKNTGKILYAKNENEALSPASVTKIMTLLLVAEALADGAFKPEDEVTVSDYAASMGGSQVFLEAGERMSVEELIKCTVISSANDAAVALAELVSGNESAFVNKMNKRAGELGMKSANFENVTGLDDTVTNHVLSAMDIAIMSRELIKHDIITKYSSLWQDTIRDGAFTLTNTNRLVRYYDGCTGLKTGSTAKAGFCMSATAERDGMGLIAVIMGAETRDIRNAEARALLDFGFSSFALYKSEPKCLGEIKILGGNVKSVKVYSEGFALLVSKADFGKIKEKINIPESISAPVSKGKPLGTLELYVGEEKLGECGIFCENDLGKITFFEVYFAILKNLFGSK